MYNSKSMMMNMCMMCGMCFMCCMFMCKNQVELSRMDCAFKNLLKKAICWIRKE